MRILYNPTIEDPDTLKKTLVARDPVLKDLLKKIRSSSEDRGLKHYLIVGPRGMGKTHLLLVLHYTVKGDYKQDKDLARSWVSIKTHEEEYSITTLPDLLLRILEELKEEGISGEIEGLRERSDEEIVELALGFLRKFRRKTGKRILLLIEDLSTIFKQIGDKEAIGRIRDILMREDIFMVIGTGLSLFKEVIGHKEPFYNFFEVIWLPELKGKEIEKLIKERARLLGEEEIIERFEEYRPRIKATVHLTGGYPRLILMLFHIFTKSKLIEVQEALEELLDKLTPYFQDRMNQLPPQQKKILDTLALMDGPATPTKIAKEARLKVSIVNSQIKRLAELGYIQVSRQEKKKTTRYEVTERLFRIWREMRTIKGRKRIGFLVRFLKIWYTPKEFAEELEKLEARFTDYLKIGGLGEAKMLIEHMWYLQEAAPLELKYEIHTDRVGKLVEIGEIHEAEEAIKRLKAEAIKADDKEALATAYMEETFLCYSRGDREEASKALDEALGLRPVPVSSEAWINQGIVLEKLGRHEEALESFTKATELKPDYFEACFYRGIALGRDLGRYEEALESLTKATELKPDNPEAWLNRGAALLKLGRQEETLESFTKASNLKPDSFKAWVGRGSALEDLGKSEGALENFIKGLKLKPDSKEDNKLIKIATSKVVEISLSLSRTNALEKNYGTAEDHLKKALTYGDHIESEKLQEALVEFLKELIVQGQIEFAQQALETIGEGKGPDFTELLKPFSIALNYIKTQDLEILERLHEEVRKVVEEIIEIRA